MTPAQKKKADQRRKRILRSAKIKKLSKELKKHTAHYEMCAKRFERAAKEKSWYTLGSSGTTTVTGAALTAGAAVAMVGAGGISAALIIKARQAGRRMRHWKREMMRALSKMNRTQKELFALQMQEFDEDMKELQKPIAGVSTLKMPPKRPRLKRPEELVTELQEDKTKRYLMYGGALALAIYLIRK